jgi:uncharacterized membrane protein YphA (DoxX/SURF4 family)
MVIGAICLLIGMGAPLFLFIGAGLIIAAYMVRHSKTSDYYVMLTTSSGQVQAVKSKNREYIGNIVQALNDCIVARG